MLIKSVTVALVMCLSVHFAQAQENKILVSFKDSTSAVIKKGDFVRMAYPSAKLGLANSKKAPEFLGFRGKVDSISVNEVWLQIDKRTNKKKSFLINDITAIKQVSKSAELFTFLGSWAVIGTGAAVVASAVDLTNGSVIFAGVFSLFPAAILTANVFYPTKPKHKVGEEYTIKVITIN